MTGSDINNLFSTNLFAWHPDVCLKFKLEIEIVEPSPDRMTAKLCCMIEIS